MKPAVRGDLREPRIAAVAAIGILLLFIAVRIPLAFVRNPFFDELFTSWIARKPLGAMLRALMLDSGPPLYYAAVNLLTSGSVDAARYLSLVASAVALVVIVATRALGESRWVAALLLAVYPPAFYFATEARSYALAGALAGIAAIALDRWADLGSRNALAFAAAMAVLAAHTHYYGMLLIPLPVALVLCERMPRERLRDALIATAAMLAAVLPAIWLARVQPPEAMRWIGDASWEARLVEALRHASFASPYPEGFLPQPSIVLQIIAGAVTLTVLIVSFRDARTRRFAILWLVPLAAAIVLSAIRPVYFALRFESVTAVAFVLWLAFGIYRLPRALRAAVFAVMVVIGAVVAYSAIVEHARGVIDPHREAAQFARLRTDARRPVVVSGLAYLETLGQRGGRWQPPVVAFPAAQAEHPGWRAEASEDDLRREGARLGDEFTWIGEIGSLEHRILAERWTLDFRFESRGVAVASARSMRVRQ
ncbi:MAG: hypothetical protein ACYC7A_14700 [Thermoanaerobaculia bacterium]